MLTLMLLPQVLAANGAISPVSHLQLAMLPLLTVAQSQGEVPADQIIPGRPWTSIIPDPDKYDWNQKNRPGYRIREMTPNQRKFYDYVKAKVAAGQPLNMTEQAMRRFFITSRQWPDPPQPSPAARAYMRWLREQPNSDMTRANELMLSQLMANGLVVLDRAPTKEMAAFAEYLKSKSAQPKSIFETYFVNAVPWAAYWAAAEGYDLSGVKAIEDPAGQKRVPSGHGADGPHVWYSVGGASVQAMPGGGFRGTFKPGGTLSVACTIQVGGLGSDVHVLVGANNRVREIKDFVPNTRDKTGKPDRKSYSASIQTGEDARTASILVANHPRYTMGNNSGDPVFSASLTADPESVAALHARDDAYWRQQVEATLKSLGQSMTADQARVEAMRQAARGGDEAWKAYVDAEQARLGYERLPEAQAFFALDAAIENGGDAWKGWVDANGPPATQAKGGTPDLRGVWSSNFGDHTIRQEGNRVWGTYSWQQGQFAGLIEDGVLYFWWWEKTPAGTPFEKAELGERGDGYMRITDGGQRLVGLFRYAKDFASRKPPAVGQDWVCNRKGPAPQEDSYAPPPFQQPDGAFNWRGNRLHL